MRLVGGRPSEPTQLVYEKEMDRSARGFDNGLYVDHGVRPLSPAAASFLLSLKPAAWLHIDRACPLQRVVISQNITRTTTQR
jgi:hypothetical protein